MSRPNASIDELKFWLHSDKRTHEEYIKWLNKHHIKSPLTTDDIAFLNKMTDYWATQKTSCSNPVTSTISLFAAPQTNSSLIDFCKSARSTHKMLVVVGAGTAAWTYLRTCQLDPDISHIMVLGNRGYWSKVTHRLAQTEHLLALPDEQSAPYIDPELLNQAAGIAPTDTRSAYMDSTAYQATMDSFAETTVKLLTARGLDIYFDCKAEITHIDRDPRAPHAFSIKLNGVTQSIPADQIIIATGAGPERHLTQELYDGLYRSCSNPDERHMARSRVLGYTDALADTAHDRLTGKDILIYGGGATAAWVAEMAESTGTPCAWVAKNGFGAALTAGPRVESILARTKGIQAHATITHIAFAAKAGEEGKLMVSLAYATGETRTVVTDYLVNSIGQDQHKYGLDALSMILSPGLCHELNPVVDMNHNSGDTHEHDQVAWATPCKSLMVIGAAQSSFYQPDSTSTRSSLSVSRILPKGGQVAVTLPGVVASVCALTNYMPISQRSKTGVCKLIGLNLNLLNATQLAVYFTVMFPDAPYSVVNNAVDSLIAERRRTHFGLSDEAIHLFTQLLFADFTEDPHADDDSEIGEETKSDGSGATPSSPCY